MTRVTARCTPIRYAAGEHPRPRQDVVAVEEPLQIRIRPADSPLPPAELTVTMRTPGADFDLVAGFLVGEGVIRSAEQITAMRYCAGTDPQGQQTYNVVDVTLAPGVAPPATRQGTTTSACGICGTTSIEDVLKAAPPWSLDAGDTDAPLVSIGVLLGLPERLRGQQTLFERTGGVHAAGLFAPSGDLLCLREDVGRHNAVDKVLGWALREARLPLTGTILQVSGRASFELVQKARQGGIPVLAAVGAPSSLAVQLAELAGVTLVGFSRGSSANVYSHQRRIR